MKDCLCDIIRRYRHLILYGIIGSLSASIDFGIFTMLSEVTSIPFLIINSISVVCGITCSFCLNRIYNFKVKDHVIKRYTIFLIVGLCGLLLSNIILYVAVNISGINCIISKLLSIFIVALLQFLANKYIAFKQTI